MRARLEAVVSNSTVSEGMEVEVGLLQGSALSPLPLPQIASDRDLTRARSGWRNI